MTPGLVATKLINYISIFLTLNFNGCAPRTVYFFAYLDYMFITYINNSILPIIAELVYVGTLLISKIKSVTENSPAIPEAILLNGAPLCYE